MAFRKVIPTIAIGVMPILCGLSEPLFAQCARWQKVDVGFLGQINGVAMSPDGRHIVTDVGHSSDGGATWELFEFTIPEILAFGDNAHLFAVASSQGCNLTNGSAALYRSTDYGKSWDTTSVRTPMCFREVFFLDSLSGWAVGYEKDSVVFTNDGGKTLQTRFFCVPGIQVNGVYFADAFHGWAAGWLVGADSAILRTTDGGNSWTVLPIGIAASVAGISVHFPDSLHGWFFASYNNGQHILTSSDGGRTWKEQATPPHQILWQVKAIDSLQCWMIGVAPFPYDQRKWKTTDGGQSWITEYSGPGGSLRDLDMADNTHGVAVGNSGTVLIYSPVVTMGDLNGDGQITVTDVVLELNKVFLELPYPCIQEAGDVNCDGNFSAADLVLLLRRGVLGVAVF